MKELIAVSTHCPTLEKRKVLLELLLGLQKYRDKYDLLLVSHQPVSETICELVDIIYDRFNDILEDFELTNSFTFENSDFLITSSLVFPRSTHLAVYTMVYNSINFAKFNGYRNLHYVEYDLMPENLQIITEASLKLMEYDSFFVHDFETDWTHGPYRAFRVDNLQIEYPMSKEKIINELRESHSKHTEHIFSKLTAVNRTIHYYDVKKLKTQFGKIDLIDSHNARGLNWVIPVYNAYANKLSLFIYNEHGEDHTISVTVNGNLQNYPCPQKHYWSMSELCDISYPIKIQITIDSILSKSIELTPENIEAFKNKNSIIFKDHD
jgi:hypothetical protein